MSVKKLGELLVETGLITQDQLDLALKEAQEQKGVRLGSVIVKKGYATDIDIAQTLSFQLNIPYVDMSSAVVDPEAIKLVSERLAKKYFLIPLQIEKKQDRKILKVAMSDPLNLNAIDDIRFSTGLDVQPCVSTLSDVSFSINRHYHLNEPLEDLITDFKRDRLIEVVHEVDTNSRDISEQVKKSSAPPIIKMVDSMIIHAIDSKASDIHIEPQERDVKLRLRIDGIMRETMHLPKWVQGSIVSRIKIMSNLDIAERRISQDGRIKVRLSDKSIDIRVSTLPTQYGETVVMRLLDPKSALLDLETIGLSKEAHEMIIDMIERPQGVVLVTGPTGSGKTSTLYSMIRHIKSEEINIITIEDPIEYELKDVNQVAVNEKTGLTFAYSLRSILRQDPDVILVGEMRDAETATIAHQASLTGHLVFSSLHTNDAVSSIIRLKNMGIPHYIIASSLNGILAQRLVRKICPHCKESYIPSDEELKKAGVKLAAKSKLLYRGTGCNSCNWSGYSGRVGIFEVLRINSKLRSLISTDSNEQTLLKAASEAGMVSLQIDGLKKVASGVTTLDELKRVVYLSKEDRHKEECPVCMSPAPEGAEICAHCGHALKGNCPACRKPRQSEWKLCPYCGHSFKQEGVQAHAAK